MSWAIPWWLLCILIDARQRTFQRCLYIYATITQHGPMSIAATYWAISLFVGTRSWCYRFDQHTIRAATVAYHQLYSASCCHRCSATTPRGPMSTLLFAQGEISAILSMQQFRVPLVRLYTKQHNTLCAPRDATSLPRCICATIVPWYPMSRTL